MARDKRPGAILSTAHVYAWQTGTDDDSNFFHSGHWKDNVEMSRMYIYATGIYLV